MRARILSPLLLTALAAVPALAQPADQRDQPAAQKSAGPSAGAPEMGELTSDDILGKQARNAQGQELGKVENLVVDPRSGKITHVVVAVGGFLGIGDKQVAVPWNDVDMRQEAMVLDVTREELQAAQPFREQAAAAPGGTAGSREPPASGAPAPSGRNGTR